MTAILEAPEAPDIDELAAGCEMCRRAGDGPERARHVVTSLRRGQQAPLTSRLCCRHFGLVMGPMAIVACRRAGHPIVVRS